ncbi:Calx-beta domain-containing protein [Vibrio sp. Y58_MX_L22]|uniref:Calx-beta domain-containing protein n=1 Tax=Vibrio sp. Y58_MX_L22 TaxID=2957763 RepID=UPI0020A4D88B|nr:Calx-beta domain-containing protein [Vibrio sp. Y58_MX_L22]
MERVTFSSLAGNIVVIGLDGEIRTLGQGQLPQPGELIIDEVSDTSELVIEQVTPQGSSINVTDDITALIEAIASGEDPTELGEEFEPAAGEGNGSSPQNTGAIDRTGAELLASTNFETVGTDGTGFSSTQVETLLDILQIQPPEPTATPIPATIIVQEISSPTINEGDQVVFDITLNQATEDNTDVTLSLLDGTATGGSTDESGSDYVNERVLITFSDGTTEEILVDDNGTFTVSVPLGESGFTVSLGSIDDSIFEGPETFTLSGTTEEQNTPATGVATIVDDGSGPGLSPDDDRPTVTMSDAGIVNEGETASFKVSLSNPSAIDVEVELTLNLGDTEAGDLGLLEYNTGSGWVAVPNDGVVTVPAGQTEFDVRIASIDDAVYEGPEDFSVTVTGIGAVQGSDTGTATIVDDGSGPGPDPDDDRPNVTITDAGTINEGETANFKVTLSNASESTVQLELGLNLGDTEAGDLGTLEYNTGSGWVAVPNDGVVTVRAGQTEFDVRIASIDDAVYEGPEDFSVTVTGIGAVQGSDTGMATIVDDGSGPGPDPDDDRPSVTITDAGTINEGDTANFKVTLSNASEAETQVELGLNLVDTEAGDLGTLEYNTGSGWVAVPNDGVVTVPAGQTEFDVRIASIDDAVYEGPEGFSVTVTGIGAVQGSDTGTATIVDDGSGPGPDPDDDRPNVTITDAGTINEGETANFKVTLSNASESTVQVELGLNLGDTEVGDLGTLEYNTGSGWVAVPNDGVVTVPAGQTEFDVRIASIDDAVYEGPEDFSVTVTGIGAVQGSDTGTATIVDDGSGPGPDPDDDRPNVTITDAGTINEGDTANFKVTLSNASESTVQVELGLNLGDTEAGDLGTLEYNTGSGWVAVPNDGVVTVPAEQTEFDVRIASIDDAVYEGPEDFSVTVTGIGAVQGSDTGTATIVDDGSGPGPDPDDDRPNVTISDAGIINEGETANFKVTLSNASEAETQVELGLNLGDTEVGDLGTLEYNTGSGWVAVPNDGVVTVPAGQTEFDVRIASIDDAVYEGPEDFSVTVTGIGAVQGSDTGTATIVDDGSGPGPDPDDDRPNVTITDAGTINEGETANFKVTLSNASESTVQVELGLNLGDTEAGDLGTLEYNTGSGWVAVPNDGVVTVPAGQTEFDVRIASIDDAVYEGPEDFSVTVTGIGAVQGSDTGTATIVDDGSGPGPDPDDDRPSVTITDAGTINEGETANFTVTLSNASEAETQVELGLNLGDTEVGDLGTLEYNTGSGWVTVPNDGVVTVPAEQTEFDVRIASIDDTVYEGPEDFSVTVTGIGAVQGSDTGTATIVDDGSGPGPDPDDDRPVVAAISDTTVSEGESATLVVTLSNLSTTDTLVNLALNDGTAEGGVDYTKSSVTVTYADSSSDVIPVNPDGTFNVSVPAGDMTFDIVISTTDDELFESDENFTLIGQTEIQTTPVTGTVTILDNDTVSVASISSEVVNEGEPIIFDVTLSNPSDSESLVNMVLADGSAEGGIDYINTSVTVTYADNSTDVITVNANGTFDVSVPANDVSFSVTVNTIDDDLFEGAETLTLSGKTATQITSAIGTGTLLDDGSGPGPDPDDDRPTVAAITDAIVSEGELATLEVTLSNASTTNTVVNMTLANGTAEGGSDYTNTTVTVTYADSSTDVISVNPDGTFDVIVPALDTTFSVTMVTLNDDIYEGDENFTLSGATTVQTTAAVGTVTINDNADIPTVTEITDIQVVEGNDAKFNVTLSNASAVAIMVSMSLLDGTAVAGDDFNATSVTITYADNTTEVIAVNPDGTFDVSVPASDTNFSVTVNTVEDQIYESSENFVLTGSIQGQSPAASGLGTIIDDDNTPPTVEDFGISVDLSVGGDALIDFAPHAQDFEDDFDLQDDKETSICVTTLPDYGYLYYLDDQNNEVILDIGDVIPETTEVRYALTEDFFDEQSFDSQDLLDEFSKDFIADSVDVNGLSFFGGTIDGNGDFVNNAQIKVDFAAQQVGLVVVSPGETGQGDEISTSEFIAIELDEGLEAKEARLNLASLNDRFNSGGAWIQAYFYMGDTLVDIQTIQTSDIVFTGNQEGYADVSLSNGSFDEIRLFPETDSSSDKASFTLVGTQITSFNNVNDSFDYKAIDSDGLESDTTATVDIDFNNVSFETVTAFGTQTASLQQEPNIIMGTDQDDVLVGTDGNDILIGGLGNDILTGGGGDDIFKWTEMQSAIDTVTDFSDGDQLDFTDVFDDMSGTDISTLLDDLGSGDYHGSVDDITVAVTESGGNSTLTINKDGQQLEVNFDGASASDIANSLISNLEQLRE